MPSPDSDSGHWRCGTARATVSGLGLRASLKRARCCKNDKSGRPNSTFTASNHCPNPPTSSLLTQVGLISQIFFRAFITALIRF